MILVSDENVLFEQWHTPSATVEVKTTESVEVNRAINAFVVFSGCKLDKAGHCSVEMRFRVLQPDGKVYAETPEGSGAAETARVAFPDRLAIAANL